MHSPDAEDVERIDDRAVQAGIRLSDHFLLAVRMRAVRIDLAVEGRVRIRRQPDQRRATFVVALSRLDHGDLSAVWRVHHLADVREPL
jgi:hypothetical protein